MSWFTGIGMSAVPTVPICTMVPPGRTRSNAARRAGGAPDASKTMSKPRPVSSCTWSLQIVRGRVQGHIRAQFDCLVAAGRNNIADRNRNRTKGARRHGYQQAYGSSAGHEHPLARNRSGTLDCVQGDGERLHHGADAIVHVVRQQMTLVRADGDEFRQCSIGRRGGAGATQHDGLAAEIDLAAFAVGAKAAGTGGVYGHPLAHFNGVDAGRDRGHFGSKFVAENKRTVGDKGGVVPCS